MKRTLSLLLAVLLLVGALPMSAAAELPFSDVPEGAWYYDDVRSAVERGLINGRPSGVFAPDDDLTYAEAVKLAACMSQRFSIGTVSLQNGDPWYQSYVDYCRTAGIITHDYDWLAPATRAGYMEIFANALPDIAMREINTVEDGTIPDVPMDHPQAAAVYKLYRAGVLRGSSDTYQGVLTDHLCKPGDNIRRSEVAAILTRMMDAAARVSFSMTVPEPPAPPEPLAVSVDKMGTVLFPAGVDVTAHAAAQGGTEPYAFQWLISTDKTSYTPIVGQNTAALTWRTTTLGTYYVVCRIADAAGEVRDTERFIVMITSAPAPAVTVKPAGTLDAKEGETLSFKASANGGTGPYTWQWELSADGGKTWSTTAYNTQEATFRFDVPAITQAVRCRVTDAVGTVGYSDTVTVNVGSNHPIITRQPENQVVPDNTMASFRIEVTGGREPYTYLWECTDRGDWRPVTGLEMFGYDSPNLLVMIKDHIWPWRESFRCTVTDANGEKVVSDIVTADIKH